MQDIGDRAEQLQRPTPQGPMPGLTSVREAEAFPGSRLSSAMNIPIFGHRNAIASAAGRVENTDRPMWITARRRS
jgi:hypothetical protein